MKELTTFTWISIFAISAMVVNGIGILIIYKNKDWANRTKEYFMCFAAGVLISSPLIIAFPEAIEKNQNAGFAALIGFIFMFFSNKFIKTKTDKKDLAFGITAIQGIFIHSIIDGIIYTVTFSISTFTGILTGIGLVAHEFSEGIITFSILIKCGLSAKKAMVYAFIVAAMTTPVGAFIAYPFMSRISSSTLGLALGFVAGVLIYVSAAHLLPEINEYPKKHSNIAFLAGVALVIFIMFTEH